MEVVCANCDTHFKIPDEKIPQNKVVAVACPKCKNKIPIDTRPKANGKAANGGSSVIEEVTSKHYDAADRPFDYLEEGARTALLCEKDPGFRKHARAALESMGYSVKEAGTARDSLKQMRFHIFDMIVLNELFDTDNPDNNHVLKYLSRLSIVTRRQMFVVLLTDRHRTMDNMAAFTKSVNTVINTKNMDEIGKILPGALADHQQFYKTYEEVMKKTGRI